MLRTMLRNRTAIFGVFSAVGSAFRTIGRHIIAMFAVAALLLATPTLAQSKHDKHYDNKHQEKGKHHNKDKGPKAGEIIAGALLIGGIAAIIAGSKDTEDKNYDRGYRGKDYRGDNYRGDNYRYDERGRRRAVRQCVTALENRTSRWGGSIDVTDVRGFEPVRAGYRITGHLVINEDGYYDRRGRYHEAYYNEGRFSCDVHRGRLDDIQIVETR